jgi:2-iminobutanoate/2-iminopropanoate deaminase
MKQAHSTDDAPSAPAFLSQAISAGGFIFVAGQVHSTSDGQIIEGSTKEKLDQIMKNIAAVLKSAGATINDVVKATIYVTDMAQMPEINETYPTYFQEPYPAREAVCVKQLPLGATIEISVIAAKE